MTTRAALVPVLATMLMLTGCATAADAAAWDRAEAAASASASAAANAQLRPWTAVLAAQTAKLDASRGRVSTRDCAPERAGKKRCRSVYSSQVRSIEKIRESLGDAVDPTSSTFVGALPEALSPLWTKTTEAASAASKIGKRWHAHCRSSSRIRCKAVAVRFEAAVTALSARLDEWKPYL